MYADRYTNGPAFKPGSLGLALVATALPLVAMVIGLQIQQNRKVETTIETYHVPLDPIPPVDPPRPQPHPKQQPTEHVSTPIQTPVPTDNKIIATVDVPKTPPSVDPPVVGTGDIGKVEPVKPPPPKLVGAQVDPKYAGLLQPPYPAEEQRAGRSGRVVLRVLIGPDGRVHQVERVEATTDAFFAAAQRQALTKWRFKPATQDGVAIEQWKTMSLRFELHDE